MRKILIVLISLLSCCINGYGQDVLHIVFANGSSLYYSTSHTKTEYTIIPKSINRLAFLRMPNDDEWLVYDNSYYESNHNNAVQDYLALKDRIEEYYCPCKGKEISIIKAQRTAGLRSWDILTEK